jgi:hypothetical protein
MSHAVDGGVATGTAKAAGTYITGDLNNESAKGGQFYINITAISAGSLTVTIEGKDPASGTYYTVLASAALTTTGFTLLTIYPGLTASANVVANQILPKTFRIKQVVATGPATYTIGQSLIG